MVCVSRPAARQGPDQLMGGHNHVHEDTYGNSSQDGTMMMREVTARALDATLTYTHTHTPERARRILTHVHKGQKQMLKISLKPQRPASTLTPDTHTHTPALSCLPPSHLACQSQLHCSLACPSLSPLQKHRERRRSSTASNGFPGNFNPFPGNGNLPDLVQQSPSPLLSPSNGAQVCGAAPAPNDLSLAEQQLVT